MCYSLDSSDATPQGIQRQLGLAQPPRLEWYCFNLNFDTDIATTVEVTKNVQLDATGDMVITRFNAEFWITAALSSAVAGTPLTRRSDPSSAANQVPSLAMLTARLSTNQWEWQNQSPIRLSLLVGNGEQPNWDQVMPVIRANDTFTAVVKNNSAVSVQGQICLRGFRIIRAG